jgi:hypothetical protein
MKKVFLLAGLFGLFTLCANAQSGTQNKTNSKSVAKNTTRPKHPTTSSTATVTPNASTQKAKIVATHKKHKKKMHKKAAAKQ